MPTWFDAHLDLAYLAVSGRDMLAPLDPAASPHPPAAVTLPALTRGGVRMALATIFTEPIDAAASQKPGPETYPAGDAERAFVVGRAQLEAYLTWQDRGAIALDLAKVLAIDPGVGEIRGGMGVAEVVPLSTSQRLARLPKSPALHLGILMENADPIRSPADVGWWRERGIVAVGLTWAKSSRYAGGNSGPSTQGLSPQGRELVDELDRRHILHDASHLSDASFHDLCERTSRCIVATHSNCRAITDPSGQNQRHLTDHQIKEIIRRDGVVGLNLLASFLAPNINETSPRPSIDQALAHVEHVCTLAGDKRHVGLGSDMDGGFTADRLPQGINRPSDLVRLAEGLRAKGWNDEEVESFTCGNWMRVVGKLGV